MLASTIRFFGSRNQLPVNAKPQFTPKLYLLAMLILGSCLSNKTFADEGRESIEQDAKPNVVFILVDDLGWTDLGYNGTKYYQTPNIDRLAKSGLRMQSFYACQNCAPTRAALMSGQYAPRTGVYTVGSFDRGKAKNRQMLCPENQKQLPLDKVTVAESLQKAGYVTGMFGKWHLGTDAEHHPLARGFTEAIVSNGRHFNFKTNPDQGEPAPETYLADYLTDRAVDFIDRHHDEPFFLYLPHFAVHTPIQAKPELIEKFKAIEPVGGHNNPKYAAMIQSVDESVGRVIEKLEELGIRENTLVLFMSDNGGLGGYRIPGTEQRKGITDNFPLRGGKGKLYEGGVRVPFIASMPGTVPSGLESWIPGVHVDLYPTLLAVADGAAPDDYSLDGTNLWNHFQSPEDDFEREAIYWHFPGYLESYIPEDVWRTTPVSTIRDGQYKLMRFYETNTIELYDLEKDLSETNDLSEEMPEKVTELTSKLDAWLKETNALMATPK